MHAGKLCLRWLIVRTAWDVETDKRSNPILYWDVESCRSNLVPRCHNYLNYDGLGCCWFSHNPTQFYTGMLRVRVDPTQLRKDANWKLGYGRSLITALKALWGVDARDNLLIMLYYIHVSLLRQQCCFSYVSIFVFSNASYIFFRII